MSELREHAAVNDISSTEAVIGRQAALPVIYVSAKSQYSISKCQHGTKKGVIRETRIAERSFLNTFDVLSVPLTNCSISRNADKNADIL